MRLFRTLGCLVLVTALFVSCDDFGDINEDPNNPSTVKTELLLTNAQTNIGLVVGATIPVEYVQHMSQTQYTQSQRYQAVKFDFSGWYFGPLKDLQTIIDLNSNPETADEVLTGGSNANQIAVARILKAYFYHFMTDRWGYLPYSEALQGNENFTPSYDSQEFIYGDLIAELKAAVDQMDGGTGVQGDILFGGDMDAWADFANTLRMRIALRMSEVDPGTAESEFVDAFNDGHISSDVMYPYLADANNENPWFTRFKTRTDWAISDVLADTMKEYNDMRLLAYASPAPDLDDGNEVTDNLSEVNGMPYHIENAGDIPNAAISFPGMALRAQDAPIGIITMAEVHFMHAEAAQRGWIGLDAATHYNLGIEASWNQWGVYGDGTDFTAYMAQPDIAYDAGSWQEQIAFQKWIAFYGQGYEAWAEWRRTGYPLLVPHPLPLNTTGNIPLRHGYPASEAELNKEAYDAAVAAQGQDYEGVALWWDQ